MSNDVVSRDQEAAFLAARRNALLWPALVATLVGGGLMALWLAQGILVAVLIHNHPDTWIPRGAIYLQPSTSEKVRLWIRFLGPVAVGTILLALTWRYRWTGYRVSTCVCAAATVVAGICCWVPASL